MKIFIVARGWPSETEPQWGCFERDQAEALSKLGHQVVVMSLDSRFRRYYRKYGITVMRSGNISVYNLFASSLCGNLLRTISVRLQTIVKRQLFLYLYNKVVKIEGKPDIVYAHYLGNCSIALAVKKKYGIPVVGIEHWSELGYDNIKKKIKYWAQNTYKDLDLLLTVSTALRENVKKNFDVNSIVVNNMVGKEFQYIEFAKNDKIKFVSTGNLLPVKGFDNLIRAFASLSLPVDSWLLNIVGGGKEQVKLQSIINQFHLNENIHLLGRKNRNGVIKILHESDVYVMSSRSETFGVAAIEALACGLPVIATDCGGARDFLTNENGVIIPVENVEKLAECISYMMRHYQEYDRAKIAADCQNRFSSEAIGKQLECIFEEVIRKSKMQ